MLPVLWAMSEDAGFLFASLLGLTAMGMWDLGETPALLVFRGARSEGLLSGDVR